MAPKGASGYSDLPAVLCGSCRGPGAAGQPKQAWDAVVSCHGHHHPLGEVRLSGQHREPAPARFSWAEGSTEPRACARAGTVGPLQPRNGDAPAPCAQPQVVHQLPELLFCRPRGHVHTRTHTHSHTCPTSAKACGLFYWDNIHFTENSPLSPFLSHSSGALGTFTPLCCVTTLVFPNRKPAPLDTAPHPRLRLFCADHTGALAHGGLLLNASS